MAHSLVVSNLNPGYSVRSFWSGPEQLLDWIGYLPLANQMIASPLHKVMGVAQIIIGMAMMMISQLTRAYLIYRPISNELDLVQNDSKKKWQLCSIEGNELVKHGYGNFIRGCFESFGTVAGLTLLAFDYTIHQKLGHKIFHYRSLAEIQEDNFDLANSVSPQDLNSVYPFLAKQVEGLAQQCEAAAQELRRQYIQIKANSLPLLMNSQPNQNLNQDLRVEIEVIEPRLVINHS
jgi:hypothetical protein